MSYLKKYFLTFVVLAILLSLGIFWLFTTTKEPSSSRNYSPHFYKDLSRDISEIKIKIFYVVPKNKSVNLSNNWQDLIIPTVEDSIKFHQIQFRGLSKLSYDIFPQPLILDNDSIFYDTENTDKGNPEGLKNIVKEIEIKAPDFIKTERGVFSVIAVIYEGVGASGSDGAMILSRIFLSDQQYESFRSSLFYHEFGHTLGLPDEYDTEINTPYSNDIMGAGRRKPINSMYISRNLLKDMGIIQ